MKKVNVALALVISAIVIGSVAVVGVFLSSSNLNDALKPLTHRTEPSKRINPKEDERRLYGDKSLEDDVFGPLKWDDDFFNNERDGRDDDHRRKDDDSSEEGRWRRPGESLGDDHWRRRDECEDEDHEDHRREHDKYEDEDHEEHWRKHDEDSEEGRWRRPSESLGDDHRRGRGGSMTMGRGMVFGSRRRP